MIKRLFPSKNINISFQTVLKFIVKLTKEIIACNAFHLIDRYRKTGNSAFAGLIRDNKANHLHRRRKIKDNLIGNLLVKLR